MSMLNVHSKKQMQSIFSTESLCLFIADFSGMVRFGVVTNKQVAEAISLKDDESIYLYRRLNSSLVSTQTSDSQIIVLWHIATPLIPPL